MKTLLEVRGLSVAFGGKEVVHGIDFTIAPGEKLALVGESGSGKTVSALALLGLVQNAVVTGSAMFAAGEGEQPRDLLTLPERDLLEIRGREIAMIFQEPMTALNPLYTVGDQIAEVLQLKEGLSAREAWNAAVEALRATGLPDPERRALAYPHQLSGGQRQRAMIAMALSGRPRLLLADEPTTALDVTLRTQILDLLSDIQQHNGMAMLLITHDLNLVRKFADRVAVMENGYLVEHGPVADIFANPQHPYTRKLIDSRPVRDVVEEPAPAEEPVMQARGMQVSYPINLPGIKGWFSKGEFVAVKDAAFSIAPGPHAGRGRRVGFRQVHAGAGGAGPDAAPRRAGSCRHPLGARCRAQQGHPPSGAGGVPGPVLVPVAPHDGRGNRGRGPARARTGPGASRPPGARDPGAPRRGPERSSSSRGCCSAIPMNSPVASASDWPSRAP